MTKPDVDMQVFCYAWDEHKQSCINVPVNLQYFALNPAMVTLIFHPEGTSVIRWDFARSLLGHFLLANVGDKVGSGDVSLELISTPERPDELNALMTLTPSNEQQVGFDFDYESLEQFHSKTVGVVKYHEESTIIGKLLDKELHQLNLHA